MNYAEYLNNKNFIEGHNKKIVKSINILKY